MNGGRHCHRGNQADDDKANRDKDDEVGDLRRDGNSSPPLIGVKVELDEVVDCETIRVKEFDSDLRLIGISVPCVGLNQREAEDYLKQLLESGEIHITIEKLKDGSDATDESGRRLAYVFVKDGECTVLVNLAIAWNVTGAKIDSDIRFEFNEFFTLRKSDILEHFCDFNLLLKTTEMTDLLVPNTITSDDDPSALKLAAWNIRIMSDNSRDDAELYRIAQTLIDYDFIAIVELRDEIVLQRTQRILAQMGKMYDYQFSPAVGRGVKERYAFLYRQDRVSVVKQGELYPDAADGTDDFARDPYWATFRAGAFDFSVIVVHVIWGDTVAPRKAEVRALADVYRYVQDANGEEEDVLLVGDFNRNPNDAEAYNPIMAIPSMTRLFDLPQKSHIRDSSLYDNIFFQADFVTEYLGWSGIDRFDESDFGNDDTAASLAVSDHRPVWAVFGTNLEDDDGSATELKSMNRYDVNDDGVVNILDLVAVANGFGKTDPDINGDGIVNILDLVMIAEKLGT